MTTRRSRTPRGLARARLWALWLVASTMLVGFVAMHTPVSETASASEHHFAAQLTPDTNSAGSGLSGPSPDGHHGEPTMPLDCGPMMLMCLALLIAFAVLKLVSSYEIGRVLWQRPSMIQAAQIGARQAFQALRPLQRTTVLRC